MSETMDVTGSLRKVSRELLEINNDNYSYEDQQTLLAGASWLIAYVADCLDVELSHAAARGRQLAMKQLSEGNSMPSSFPDEHVINNQGKRIYSKLELD